MQPSEMLGLRLARPGFELALAHLGAIPRANHIADMGLDWIRQRLAGPRARRPNRLDATPSAFWARPWSRDELPAA